MHLPWYNVASADCTIFLWLLSDDVYFWCRMTLVWYSCSLCFVSYDWYSFVTCMCPVSRYFLSDILGVMWLLSDIHGVMWLLSDIHDVMWLLSDIHGVMWLLSDILGVMWLLSDILGAMWLLSDIHGVIWLLSDIHGVMWFLSDILGVMWSMSWCHVTSDPFQEWMDEKLVWDNVTEFAHIQKLRIPCDLLWLPDIVLYNR